MEIDQLQQSLALAEYTKSATFVSKEQAAEEHSATIGENFMEFLGYNPCRIVLMCIFGRLRIAHQA